MSFNPIEQRLITSTASNSERYSHSHASDPFQGGTSFLIDATIPQRGAFVLQHWVFFYSRKSTHTYTQAHTDTH